MLHLLLVLLLQGLPELLVVRCFMLSRRELRLMLLWLLVLLLHELLLLSGCSGRGLSRPLLLRLLMDEAGGSLGEEVVGLGRLAARDAVGRREKLLQVGPPAGHCQKFRVAELLLMLLLLLLLLLLLMLLMLLDLQPELIILQVAGMVLGVGMVDGCHSCCTLLGGGLLLMLLVRALFELPLACEGEVHFHPLGLVWL